LTRSGLPRSKRDDGPVRDDAFLVRSDAYERSGVFSEREQLGVHRTSVAGSACARVRECLSTLFACRGRPGTLGECAKGWHRTIWGDLLELPLVAVLATYRRDGTVLLSPVWHEWRDNGFNVVTGSRDGKAGHLRRDPRASIVVCDDSPPYRGIELRTRARLSMMNDRSTVRRIATHYLGPDAGERYAETSGDDLLIRLEPGEVRAWDFAD
jgi:PPOX class probable F420-dependent enzyme